MKNYLDEIYFITGSKAKYVPSILMFVSFSSILDLLGIGLIGPYLYLLIDGKNNERANSIAQE